MGRELQEKLDSIRGGFSQSRKDIIKQVDLKKYPLISEPALIHPLNSSTVKIRENGTIDVFVGTDNGIRIDPKEKMISVLANRYAEKTAQRKQTVLRDSTSTIGGEWKVKVAGNIELKSSGRMDLTASKGVHIEGRTMTQWLDTIPQT
jgi:hypothetical protein